MKKRTLRYLALALAMVMLLGAVPAGALGLGDVARVAQQAAQNLNQDIWSVVNQLRRPVDNDAVAYMRVEDGSTVSSGTDLRADTYATGDGDTIKYFPVTLYDYDTDTINNAMHQLEVDTALAGTGINSLTQWNGIYFTDGNPGAESYTYHSGDSWSSASVSCRRNGNYSQYENNGYYFKHNDSYELVTDLEGHPRFYGSYFTVTTTNDEYEYQSSPITLYTRGSSSTTASLGYAAWNKWNKGSGDNANANGQKVYGGLVESKLNANKQIVFTKPDAGIFNNDTSVKTIYTNVEMPFVYADGFYTFDSSQRGVYFRVDADQGSTAAQSNGRLYLNNQTQSNGGNYGDGSTTMWLPFNDGTSINGEGNCNYHFGMNATVPFTMTANGRLSAADENSDPVTFHFSGDDDVWIFIDGQLVVDLGGIHNRLDADIDFANNTVTISEQNTLNVNTGDYANAWSSKFRQQADGSWQAKLFNSADDTLDGLINMTRETFAATESHELTVYYLERGKGSSNCQIKFNLPMKDTVSVTKRATQSKDSEGNLSNLTANEQAMVNAIDFGFTIYKDGEPLANASYNLLSANGQVLGNPSTDANGHFTLRNGQTARFVGELVSAGSEYYVVEDRLNERGFTLPEFSYTANVAGGSTETAAADQWTSAKVTVRGSDESADALTFVCENFFDQNLPNPSSRPSDDKIVLDYGLPVEIAPLANDLYRGDTIALRNVQYVNSADSDYGTITQEGNKIVYTLAKPLDKVIVLQYDATVTGKGNSGEEIVEESETKSAYIYIIPATTVYYEEDFGSFVTYSDGWEILGTAETDAQEPGVVGTMDDSPYGSDVAYRNDGGDSNGTSKHVSTENGTASFTYTFSGTGTTFYARTNADSGYMKVTVTDTVTNKIVHTYYRDTKYRSGNADITQLYNIPVFTWNSDVYSAYRVEVRIAVKNAQTETADYGFQFWLDGIQVVNPLNPDDANVAVGTGAYANDGEANMTHATLRNKLLAEHTYEDENGDLQWNSEAGFVVFTDSNGQVQLAEEYENNGPKEEVYLYEGQSVTFSLSDWDTSVNRVYLGIKAPTGQGAVSINGYELAIGNATDCFYDITAYASISQELDDAGNVVNTIVTFKVQAESSLISVTNIKVSGPTAFTVIGGTDPEVPGDEGV